MPQPLTVRYQHEDHDRVEEADDDSQYGHPAILKRGPGRIRCGNHPEGWDAYHRDIGAVADCYAASAEFAAQQAGEIWAENAWLRHAEAGDPASWREEELDRMAEACGLPIPPGYH